MKQNLNPAVVGLIFLSSFTLHFTESRWTQVSFGWISLAMSTGLEKDLSFHNYVMTCGSIDSPFNVWTRQASSKQNWPEEHTGASLPPHEAFATMPGEQMRKHAKATTITFYACFDDQDICQ